MNGYIKDDLLRGFDKILELNTAIGYGNTLIIECNSRANYFSGATAFFDIIYPTGEIRVKFDRTINYWMKDEHADKTTDEWGIKVLNEWNTFKQKLKNYLVGKSETEN